MYHFNSTLQKYIKYQYAPNFSAKKCISLTFFSFRFVRTLFIIYHIINVEYKCLCTRWKNVGDDTEKRESWEIASIKDGKMNWTALRENADGSTYTSQFSMTRVE